MMTKAIQTEIALLPRLDGLVRLEVSLARPVPRTALDELSSVARSFFRLADLGAYVIETALPESALFQAVGEHRTSHEIAWDCQVAATDSRIAQVFRNILVAFTQLHHPVSRLLMRTPAAIPIIALPPLGNKTMAQTYPARVRQLRFRIDHRLPRSAHAGRRYEIEFTQQLTDGSLQRIVERLALWASVSLGAYATDETDLWSGECAIFDALPDIMDNYTVEMAIERFGAPEVAWNSLLNLCGRVNADIASIDAVRIE